MKITAMLGSPRKNGFTSRIANAFLESAGQKGASVRSYVLNDMNFKGCQGCHACKTKQDHCILEDDLTPALADLQTSDILVLATPIYFWDVTGQFKLFFDRTWSLVKPDYMTNPHPVRMNPGKQAVWISSQGAEEKQHVDVMEKFTKFLTLFGCQINTIRSFGTSGDSPQTRYRTQVQAEAIAPWLKQARDLADRLVG